MTEQEGWYIQTGSKVQGPFSIQKIKQYAAAGRINPTMKLSTDRRSWMGWKDVERLMGSGAPTVPVGVDHAAEVAEAGPPSGPPIINAQGQFPRQAAVRITIAALAGAALTLTLIWGLGSQQTGDGGAGSPEQATRGQADGGAGSTVPSPSPTPEGAGRLTRSLRKSMRGSIREARMQDGRDGTSAHFEHWGFRIIYPAEDGWSYSEDREETALRVRISKPYKWIGNLAIFVRAREAGEALDAVAYEQVTPRLRGVSQLSRFVKPLPNIRGYGYGSRWDLGADRQRTALGYVYSSDEAEAVYCVEAVLTYRSSVNQRDVKAAIREGLEIVAHFKFVE